VEWKAGERGGSADYHFLLSAVAPRPIAWVTTQDPATGVVNAAPFSWFQTICAEPPMLMVAIADRADGSEKDTLRNLRAGGECVVNVATADAAEKIVASSASYAPGESETAALGLRVVAAVAVAPPRLADSPVHMECRLVETHRYGGTGGTAGARGSGGARGGGATVAVLEVIHFGADDDVLDARGNVAAGKVHFLARLGGRDYAAIRDVFQLQRPKAPDAGPSV
jgi:flavin reductase (DIM6/NTAB) family NADH-FMN oxidoreductase RutF